MTIGFNIKYSYHILHTYITYDLSDAKIWLPLLTDEIVAFPDEVTMLPYEK